MTSVRSKAVKASDVMTLGAATVRESDTVLHAVELLTDHRISALPVLDADGKVTGIVTESDFLRETGFHLAQVLATPLAARRRELERSRVREIMTRDCITIDADTLLTNAIELMDRLELKRLPVVTDGKLQGLLSRADLLRALVSDT
jgi:CBS domain-containing protein